MFKYMNLETALICLNDGTLRFSEPDRWEDKFEGRFYNADYSQLRVSSVDDTPKLYACCFTYKKMSESAWKMYNGDAKGLRAKTIQIEINVAAFRKELLSKLYNKDKVYEGRVCYDVCNSIIENIHKSGAKWHSDIVVNFDLRKYLTLLLLKRNYFSHEQELRIFIKKDNDETKCTSCLDVPIVWSRVIEHIYVAEDVSNIEMLLLKRICKDRGIDESKIKKATIYGMSQRQQIKFDK